MGARSGWGGRREGAGRPVGSISPTARRCRVVVLLNEADRAELARLAKKMRVNVGRMAYELVAQALRRRKLENRGKGSKWPRSRRRRVLMRSTRSPRRIR
jgi:hypothetical protein